MGEKSIGLLIWSTIELRRYLLLKYFHIKISTSSLLASLHKSAKTTTKLIIWVVDQVRHASDKRKSIICFASSLQWLSTLVFAFSSSFFPYSISTVPLHKALWRPPTGFQTTDFLWIVSIEPFSLIFLRICPSQSQYQSTYSCP